MNIRAIFPLVLVLLIAASVDAQETKRRDQTGDALPEGALARMGSMRLRSDASINCIAFSHDGKSLITGAYNNKLTWWDVASGKQTRHVTIVPTNVYSIQMSADGKTLAVTGSDSAIRILDAQTGEQKKMLQDPLRRYGNITAALSPNGKTAVMMHRYERQLLIWNVETGKLEHRITGVNTYNPPPLVFTPDSKQMVTIWTDNKLHLIDVATAKSVRNLEPALNTTVSMYSTRIPALALTPDGKQIVYRTSSDRFFNIMDVSSGKIVKRFERTTGYYYSSSGAFAITPNGRFVVETSGDSAVRVWGLASGKMLRELTSPGSMNQFALSRDGKKVASFQGNSIFLWDVAASRQLHAGIGHQSAINRLAFTPDGKRLISVGSTTMRVWDAGTGRELHATRPMSSYGISWLRASADGKEAHYVGSDRAVYRWRFGDAQPERLTTPKGALYFTSQAVSPNGKVLAAINSTDRKVRLIDLLGTKPDRELVIVTNAYGNQLTFSPDGRTLVLSGSDRSVTFFDIATAAETRKLMPPQGVVGYYGSPTITFSRDSRTVLKYDGEMRVIEMVSGSERTRLPREITGSNTTLVWSDDGRLLAQAHTNGAVVVYDTWTGREVLRRNGEQGSISALAFSRDGRKLAAGGANTTILVWEVPLPGKPQRLTTMDDDSAWRDLEDMDGARAFRAVTWFVSSPEAAIRIFKARLKPKPPVDAKRISKLIEDLDSDTYAVREKATEDLAEIGLAAEEALKAATKSTSLEVKRRAEDLLRKLKGGTGLAPDRLRAQRAVEILEKIGTPAAKLLLEAMLKMKIDSPLEAAIKASIERLGESS
jgi:WD40 repeat protein